MTAQIDADAAARILYLALLGGALLAGLILRRRRRLSALARDGLAWAAILLTLALLYALREPLIAALRPDLPAPAEAGALTLRRGADGHFRIAAEVNGAPVTFLLDTGASGLVLTMRDARRAGLDVDALTWSGRARTANGVVRTAPVRIETLRIGPHVLRDVPAHVNEGALFSSLMGMSVLSRFSKVSIEGDTLTLVP
ncbi:retropepsin-like aspartic protease family protein [Oceanicella actignis]|uniref:Aspartyl protease family protein n=1 Tax=Oceanicella actignis TaxID=1189325 RepID=A0A1M7RY92_9RHOB|nr:TIGR02281 family clan AA aspartic protease [Oceanicella actignis]SES96962.1 aspartyl protease family protein [Oceanicella actignis]SHN51299.1 aspartyl protease family protein [Oceanicella actignis]